MNSRRRSRRTARSAAALLVDVAALRLPTFPAPITSLEACVFVMRSSAQIDIYTAGRSAPLIVAADPLIVAVDHRCG